MATDAGKTFTAITASYRLLKYAGMKRILFLVDTKSLGEQAEREFLAYTPNDDNRSFAQLYGVRRLKSSYIPNTISVESLKNGEKVAMCILEVAQIPHSSILRQDGESGSIVECYNHETIVLLNELFQQYKTISFTNGTLVDACFELLWSTTKVENQPYNAEIDLHVIVRAIHIQQYTML